MLARLDAALRFDQQALALRARRQEVLAGNIANADTPGFKARDFDFASALRQATGQSDGGLRLATTAAAHATAQPAAAPAADLLYRTPAQSSLDGNTVEMDAERMEFADNAMHYESGLAVVSAKIKSLLAALQS